MGDSDTDESNGQTITICGTVRAKGFVGIGTTNANSHILIDSGQVNAESDLVGIYPMGGGTIQLVNGADVSISSKQYGVVMKTGTPEITNSTIEISAASGAFRTAESPILTYEACRKIAVGESKDDTENDDLVNLPENFAEYKYVKIQPCEHKGVPATCCALAVCERCGKEYGELNPDNHDGGTEIRNQSTATCTEDGYTGDTYCLGCGAKITEGETIDALGHDAEAVAAKTATCTVNGNIAYWHCQACGKYFSDEACTKEIAPADTVIKATGVHTYKDGKCIECGSADPNYKTTTPTKPSGLEETNTNTGTATKRPQTGDNSNILFWIALVFAAGAGLTGTAVYSRKKKLTE